MSTVHVQKIWQMLWENLTINNRTLQSSYELDIVKPDIESGKWASLLGCQYQLIFNMHDKILWILKLLNQKVLGME